MNFKNIEILNPERIPKRTVKAAVFDFDGTISTLRCGWEQVMKPLMLEYIYAGKITPETEKAVDDYIDASTGIQTIYQMEWLKGQADKSGNSDPSHDAWWYKDRYNERLMEQVNARLLKLESGEERAENFLIKGAKEFLKALKAAGVELYLASGTDDRDVHREAAALGVADYFSQIKGAPERKADCSKEAVLKDIIETRGLLGEELLVVGDGKVEIALGAQRGAFTIGTATDEQALFGVNPVKRERLLQAGADAIIGDFEDTEELASLLSLPIA